MTRPTQKRRRRPQRYSNIHEQITDLVENMAEVSEVALALALIRAMIAQELLMIVVAPSDANGVLDYRPAVSANANGGTIDVWLYELDPDEDGE